MMSGSLSETYQRRFQLDVEELTALEADLLHLLELEQPPDDRFQRVPAGASIVLLIPRDDLPPWTPALRDAARDDTLRKQLSEVRRLISTRQAADPDVVITGIAGWAPVEAYGWIFGRPFYFRARSNTWSIAIGDDHVTPEWTFREPYGSEPYAASWMELSVAESLIRRAAGLYEDALMAPYRYP